MTVHKRLMSVRAIEKRHAANIHYHDLVAMPSAMEHDDVSFLEWLHVHEDRAALLAEVKRLRRELRKAKQRVRRTSAIPFNQGFPKCVTPQAIAPTTRSIGFGKEVRSCRLTSTQRRCWAISL